MDLVLNGKKVTVNVDVIPRMIQRITDLKKSSKNNLGEALSETLYYTLSKGKSDVALMTENTDLKFIPFYPPLQSELSLIWHKNRQLSKAAQKFLNLCDEKYS